MMTISQIQQAHGLIRERTKLLNLKEQATRCKPELVHEGGSVVRWPTSDLSTVEVAELHGAMNEAVIKYFDDLVDDIAKTLNEMGVNNDED